MKEDMVRRVKVADILVKMSRYNVQPPPLIAAIAVLYEDIEDMPLKNDCQKWSLNADAV